MLGYYITNGAPTGGNVRQYGYGTSNGHLDGRGFGYGYRKGCGIPALMAIKSMVTILSVLLGA